MNKKKIMRAMSIVLVTSTIFLGNISSVVKAETISNNISGFKNVTTSIKNFLAEDGEQELSSEECSLINDKDNKYLEEKSQDIVYEKFDVEVDEKVSDSKKVKVSWTGHGEAGNRISIYVWNVKTSVWDKVQERSVHDSKDFTLHREVLKGDYNDHSKIHVKVTSESDDDDSFSFAWMTDTQFYAQKYPDIFNTEVSYILKNKEKQNIKYAIHTGDIVNNMEQGYQWVNADNSLKMFDNASMPYGVLAGNHDVVYNDKVDYSVYKKYFGRNRYKNNPWYGGSYEDNKGHYDLLSEDKNDFIILYMGWDIGSVEYKWMNETLGRYKDRKAILCFHKYLTPEGERDEVGEGIYNNVVLKNPNVSIVLCGHYSGAASKTDEIDDNKDGKLDRKVYEILSDYQDGENGGNGYLRFMNFNAKSNTMDIKTYSPKIDDYDFYNNSENEKNSLGYKDEFTIPLSLNKSKKVLATDLIIIEGTKEEAVSVGVKKEDNLEKSNDNLEDNKETAVDESQNEAEGSKDLDKNTAETGDIYLEMFFIILVISALVGISEFKIRKAKKM